VEQFCISVALEVAGQTELGVVLRPASGECYSAVRGQGLTHNGQSCRPGMATSLNNALIGTGFPYRSQDLKNSFFPCCEDILYSSRGIRRFGAAALDLCYLAAGFLQGFWESDLQPYDVAAALLFLTETGVLATNQNGIPYSPYRDRLLVCGFPHVHQQLLPIIARHYPPDLHVTTSTA
jgi:myo-inositol-1(or 4)-monophosphatase